MPIRGGNPFEEIEELLERMGSELEDLPTPASSVAVDVEDRGDEFVVTADLPGFEKGDLEVTIADSTLRIEAEREAVVEDEGEFLRRERSRESASRVVRLPAPVAEDEISATYDRGVLTVTLPKRGGDGGSRIEIE